MAEEEGFRVYVTVPASRGLSPAGARAVLDIYLKIATAVLNDEALWETDSEALNKALAGFDELQPLLDSRTEGSEALLQLREIANGIQLEDGAPDSEASD